MCFFKSMFSFNRGDRAGCQLLNDLLDSSADAAEWDHIPRPISADELLISFVSINGVTRNYLKSIHPSIHTSIHSYMQTCTVVHLHICKSVGAYWFNQWRDLGRCSSADPRLLWVLFGRAAKWQWCEVTASQSKVPQTVTVHGGQCWEITVDSGQCWLRFDYGWKCLQPKSLLVDYGEWLRLVIVGLQPDSNKNCGNPSCCCGETIPWQSSPR